MKLFLVTFTLLFAFVANAETSGTKSSALFCPMSWVSCCESESFLFEEEKLVRVGIVDQNSQRRGWLVKPEDVVKVDIRKEDQINVEFAVNHFGANKPYQTKVFINLKYDLSHQPPRGPRNEYFGDISVRDSKGDLVSSRDARCVFRQ